jgi:hypothetical protein
MAAKWRGENQPENSSKIITKKISLAAISAVMKIMALKMKVAGEASGENRRKASHRGEMASASAASKLAQRKIKHRNGGNNVFISSSSKTHQRNGS